MPSARALPSDSLQRLAAAAGVMAGAGAVWAIGLPKEIYTWALIFGGVLALLLLLRGTGDPRLTTLALAAVGLFASLVLGDVVLRSPLARQLFPRDAQLFAVRWPPNPELNRYQPNSRFEGSMFGDIAGVTGRVEDREPREIVATTDPRGFRNPPPLPEGPLDAILLGDSFGAGSNTTDDETWLMRLRSQGLRIYNLSVPGSPWGELITLKTELPGLETRPGATLIWAIFTGNDLEDRYRDDLEPPEPNGALARASARFTTFRRRSPLRRLWSGHFGRGFHVERAAQDPKFLYLAEYAERGQHSREEVEAHPNLPRLARVFTAMAEFTRQQDLRVLVVMLPTKWETYAWWLDPTRESDSTRPSGFAQSVEALAKREGFAFVDLKPALVAEARSALQTGEMIFWRDDTHWNGRGQRVAAAVVAPLLRP